MTDDRILDIAHRTATRYAHTAVDPATTFAFTKTHMIDFGRKILAETAQPDCRTCTQHVVSCWSPLRCTNGDKYEAAPAVVLWRTE